MPYFKVLGRNFKVLWHICQVLWCNLKVIWATFTHFELLIHTLSYFLYFDLLFYFKSAIFPLKQANKKTSKQNNKQTYFYSYDSSFSVREYKSIFLFRLIVTSIARLSIILKMYMIFFDLWRKRKEKVIYSLTGKWRICIR